MINTEDVLAQLDAAHEDLTFPDLNHPYHYAIDCRLHAFGDQRRWALIVETVGYNPRGSNVFDVLHYFGNCLTQGGPGFEEDDFLPRIDNMDQVEDPDEPETLGETGSVQVRGREFTIQGSPGDELIDALRGLVPQHRESLLATETELRRRIPADLPKLLQLEDWHQPDLYEQMPSESEVYRQLASVVATANPELYRPSEGPNTHWSDWESSGEL